MVNFILDNPGISTFLLSSIAVLVGAGFKQYMKTWTHERALKALWSKLGEEVKSIRELHDKDRQSLCAELDEMKELYSTTNVQILAKLDAMTDKLGSVGEGLARVEGWIAGQNHKAGV